MQETEHIKSSVENGIGWIVLNRPSALNALTLDMIRTMDTVLQGFENDKNVRLVIVTSTSDKAFCAGGDVKSVALAVKNGAADKDTKNLPARLFAAEYKLNARIKRFSKLYISFIDGICMGGGMGISVHGNHRIVTGRSVFAMPEVHIGFFPDVGSGSALNDLKGEIGTYLGITGSRINGADMLKCGLATHYIDQDGIAPLLENLKTADWKRSDPTSIANAILANYCEEGNDVSSALEPHFTDINRIFALNDPQKIMAELEKETASWAGEALGNMQKACPLSVRLTLAHLRAMRDKSFESVMRNEYRLAMYFTDQPDFYEGIRAMLIDKDYAPQWSVGYEDIGDDIYRSALATYKGKDLKFDSDE